MKNMKWINKMDIKSTKITKMLTIENERKECIKWMK